MLIERTAKDFVYDVASESPTPGGGSVAALVGSLGGALTNMVGNLTIDKKIYADVPEDKKATMEKNFKELEVLVDELLDLVDEDSTAFDDVMQAFKLPKDTDGNKKIRSEAIQSGYKKALEVPLRCGERCHDVLKLQNIFAEHGNINAITDVGVGTLLAYAGLEGALFNVTINLKSIKDQDYKNEMEKRVETLLMDGKALRDSLLEVVYGRLKA
ncbi:MAG TPA: cyclodeaminase/cyclohydrolase family protein [Tissierellaceae bacterium]|jgi:formiminotetrahydrofolate cyclodeaminase|nr:cyclodeaminase/cyclohydrolase family protein [Tissierellaceae bacterium]